MTQSITGLGSGLDTASIIEQLMKLERQTQDTVKNRGERASIALDAYSIIRTQLTSLRSSATGVLRNTDWRALSATTSNENVATVSAGSGTMSGTMSFTVNSLATSGSFRSSNIISGTSTSVAADSAIFVAAGAEALGFSTLASDNALALGSHEVKVTQASAAAVKNGGSALAASTVVNLANNALDLSVNGVAYNLTVASGTYDRTQLAAAVQAAADAAGAAVTVTVDSTTNKIKISTDREGSAATVQVTGGTSLADLGLATDASAITGTDGKVQIGSAAEQTISSLDVGGSVVLNAAAGTLTAVFSGGLRTGTVTGKNVSVGDGTLGAVVANINGANAGVTASAVQVGTNQYRLQIASNTTGANKGPNVAAAELNANVGSLVALTTGADAVVTVGSGAGSYEVTSSTNTVSGLLPGVTVTLKSANATPVTITVSRDGSAMAAKVQAIVDSANDLQKSIASLTAYDPETKKASPLTGDAQMRRLVSSMTRALTDSVPWATPGSPGLAGLSVDKEGKYTFDSSKFLSAFSSDPEGLSRVFAQGGTATDAQVSFVSAGDRTKAGTYAVSITQAATHASDLGLEGAWPIGSPPTVRVRIGSTEASYVVKVTDQQSDVAAGLNSALQSAGLQLTASVSGTGIQIDSVQYGSGATFDVAWDGSTWEANAGLDVAGTINGVTGIGSGQQLSIAFDHASLGGLALSITATGAGALGTFTYEPGAAQRLSTAIVDATDVVTGYLTSSENALKTRIAFIDRQVESMENRLVLHEARLKRQFATLETTLGSLKQQSNWLAGQLAGLSTSNSG